MRRRMLHFTFIVSFTIGQQVTSWCVACCPELLVDGDCYCLFDLDEGCLDKVLGKEW